MARGRSPAQPFTLGAWRVDPSRGLLLREGKEVRLEPKSMELLLLFAASPGRVIAKDEIVARVWDGRAIGDDTLAAAVSRLRSALGENKSDRYIETLPKRGYRLLVGTEPAAAAATGSAERSEAAELVRRGAAEMRMMLPPALAQARVYFEGAIKLDPRRADAHAGLAEAMLAQLMFGQVSATTLLPAAKASALAATALDEILARGWSALGTTTLLADRDFATADAAFLRAIALDEGLASAHRGRAFALGTIGRFAEAERELRRAVEIEPLSLSTRNDLLQSLLVARHYGHVVAEAKRVLAISADSFQAWAAKGWAHIFLGEEDEAVSSLIESLKAMGSDRATTDRLRAAYAQGGSAAFSSVGADLFENQRVLFMPRILDVAMLRVQAGEFDAAFAALDLAAERGDPVLLVAPYLPHLDRIRNDPRFAVFLEKVRLVR